MTREKKLTTQIIVRVDPELRAALEADAAKNGRTLAQTVRHVLRRRYGLVAR